MRWLAPALALALLSPQAHAEGFDARAFRPAADLRGIGTIPGATPPPQGTNPLSLSLDATRLLVALSPSERPVATRFVAEPAISLGLPSRFGAELRFPVVVADDARTVDGARASRAGVGSPSGGLLVPIVRSPLHDIRSAARFEVAFPLGDQAAFRSDGGLTLRGGASFDTGSLQTRTATYLGALVAPRRDLRDLSLGHSFHFGTALSVPIQNDTRATASLELRLVPLLPRSTSALVTAGTELPFAGGSLRPAVGFGLGAVVGTPAAWFAITCTTAR